MHRAFWLYCRLYGRALRFLLRLIMKKDGWKGWINVSIGLLILIYSVYQGDYNIIAVAGFFIWLFDC